MPEPATVTDPSDDVATTKSTYTVRGTGASPGASVLVMDRYEHVQVVVGAAGPDGAFAVEVPLIEGRNHFGVVIVNEAGNRSRSTPVPRIRRDVAGPTVVDVSVPNPYAYTGDADWNEVGEEFHLRFDEEVLFDGVVLDARIQLTEGSLEALLGTEVEYAPDTVVTLRMRGDDWRFTVAGEGLVEGITAGDLLPGTENPEVTDTVGHPQEPNDEPVGFPVVPDMPEPVTVTDPTGSVTTTESTYTVRGTGAQLGSSIIVEDSGEGLQVAVGEAEPDGAFAIDVPLVEGLNWLCVFVIDEAGNRSRYTDVPVINWDPARP